MSLPARRLFFSGAHLIAIASVLSVLSVSLLVFSGSPEQRAREHDLKVAEAPLMAQAIARATLGRTFLELPSVDQTGYLTQKGLEGLDRGIDPGTPNGGLYPLRKAIEQLAGFVMWPMILIAIVHALVRSDGMADRKLLGVGIRFFTVVFCLWIYPLWDLMIYRGVAIPVTKVLTDGELVRDVITAIARAGGRDDWRTFADSRKSPTEALGQFLTNDARCAAELEVGGEDPRAGKACFGPEVDPSIQAMHARSVESYFPGSDSAKIAFLAEKDPEVAATIVEHNRQSRKGSFWDHVGNTWDRFKSGLGAILSPSEWLSRTVTGIFIQLQTLFASIVLWFVWLGVLIGRAFSFCLAPLAIIWGIMPNGMDKTRKWFTKHAEIALMPVGFSFALLIFYAMQVAVFATNMMTNAVIGIALKFAMFLALVTVLFKSGNISKLIAGDVTAVAADLGVAARNRTIQMAAAATAFAGGAVASGGSAVATSATAAKAAAGARALGVKALAKPTAVMDSLARRVTFNKMGVSDLAARLGLKSGGVQGQMARSAGRGSRIMKATWDAFKDTANVARASVQGGTQAAQKYGWNAFAGGNVSPSALRQFFSAPLMDAVRHMKEARKEKKERPTYVADSTAAHLRSIPEEAQERKETLRKLGLQPREIHPADLAHIASTMKVDDLVLAGRKWGDIQQGRTLATALLNNALAKGIRITATVNPDGSVNLDADTVQAISRLLETDAGFRSLVMDDARRAFGGEALPMVQGRDGKILDVAAWIKRSMAATNAVAIASILQERIDREQYRRTLVSAASGSEQNSLQEIAAHNLSHDLAQLLPNEDPLHFENRLEGETLRLLRMVWYEPATPNERLQYGLKPHGDHAAAAEHTGIDVSAWRKAESASGADVDLGGRSIPMSTMVDTIRRMAALHRSQVQDVLDRKAAYGGVTYGIDELKFKMDREHSYSYMNDSVLDQVLRAQPQLKADMERAYQEAVRETLRKFANQLPPQLANEPLEDYVRRIRHEINNFVFLDPLSAQALSRSRSS